MKTPPHFRIALLPGTTFLARPRHCTPSELAKVEVQLVCVDPICLQCKRCGLIWLPPVHDGGGLQGRYWKCRNGCNRTNFVLDLHGFSVEEAVAIADEKVAEAWANGYDTITLIHGSPGITNPQIVKVIGRGGIKWALRNRIAQGCWDHYVEHRDSGGHSIGRGAMKLALRVNQNANPVETWSPVPKGLYQ